MSDPKELQLIPSMSEQDQALAEAQFDLQTAQMMKEQGQTRVADHNPDFMEQARGIAVSLAKRCGQITADDVRAECQAQGLTCPHPNCWGALFRGKGWKAVGYTRSALPSNHARTVRIWEWREHGLD